MQQHDKKQTSLPMQTQSNDTPEKMTYLNCPQCKKLTTWQNNPSRPFCCERCRLIDLGAWASESYKIASEDSPHQSELDNN